MSNNKSWLKYNPSAPFFTLSISLFLMVSALYADPSPMRTYTNPVSNCVVESTSGEYPHIKVVRDGKILFEPQSDGIIKVVFSPNGKFIAFSGSEISGVDITPGEFDYSVVILECSSGSLRGFKGGFPEADLQWNSNNSLSFTNSVSGKKVELNL